MNERGWKSERAEGLVNGGVGRDFCAFDSVRNRIQRMCFGKKGKQKPE